MARFDVTDGGRAGDRFCMYASPDGKKCGARRTAGSRFCFFHDPAKAEERAAARRAGGLKNKPAVLPAKTPDLQLVSPQDVTRLIAETSTKHVAVKSILRWQTRSATWPQFS